MTDAVEKVGLPVGVMVLGGFDPAGVSRSLGFAARSIGGDLDADVTDAMVSDLRQAIGSAGRVVARVFGAPRS